MRLTQRPGKAGGKSQEKRCDVQQGLILEFLGEKKSPWQQITGRTGPGSAQQAEGDPAACPGRKKKNPRLWEHKYSQEIMEVIIPLQSEHSRSYLAVATGFGTFNTGH